MILSVDVREMAWSKGIKFWELFKIGIEVQREHLCAEKNSRKNIHNAFALEECLCVGMRVGLFYLRM